LRISQRSIEEVREATNIMEVASEFTALRRQGARFAGLCPYPEHQEKTPSFSIDPERGLYHCFGCKKGGDAIKLVMELKSFSFVDAVSYLADRSSVQLEFEGPAADSEVAKERSLRRRTIHKALAAAAVYYHKYLLNSRSPGAQQARSYLKRRGIEISTIEEFRLGYAPPRGGSGFLGAARKLDLDRKILEEAGLLSARGGERFSGRITFPISDRRGRIVGFGARALGDDHPKYLNSPESDVFNKRNLLYGFPQVSEALRRERAALVVEGYTDVLMLYQSGIKNAVATLGTATTPGHLRTLSGYADKIYVLFDPDEAGEKAIERAAATAAELKLDLRVLRLTQDPADWLLEHQPEEFIGLLGGAVPVLEYRIRREAEFARGASAAERARRLSAVKGLIREIDDPVFRRDAIRIAGEAFGVGVEVFKESSRPVPTVASASGSQGPLDEAGRAVLALALARPDLTAMPLEYGIRVSALKEPLVLRAEDFSDETQARIFTLLRDHRGDELDAVLSDERARPFMDSISALVSVGDDKLYPSEASVQEAWLRLRILSRERDKRETPDYDEKEQLRTEIQALKQDLRSVSAEP
jgi:DNA primase